MRIRASLAAATVSGALALTAFAVPAAQADDAPSLTEAAKPYMVDKAETQGKMSARNVYDIDITKVTVNGGKDVVVGGTQKKQFNVYVTATNPAGIHGVQAFLWHGTDLYDDEYGYDGFIFPDSTEPSTDCERWSDTTATCKVVLTADPKTNIYDSALNGKWNVYAAAYEDADNGLEWSQYQNHWVKRAAQIKSFNAAPEPVTKGKPITVTGNLSMISWTYLKYYGYGSQNVQLQFKKAGSSTYSTVKTVKTSSSGALKTTVNATVDGTWRYYYPGNSIASTATSSADYVDVR
ncbi:calcium-binding protein [Streptomyces kunmingensis]|uniref:Calcium-binding protein n=1 Tax=Streptomyces kunmingensis TaxID=68225 RepID=A0ABU6CBL4_9ACTN|nr:calcium-binding protein [Streptomyces kunmingensis]MEB3962007.1 calcium-binding protein [Streptomyces kunmingensis]